jgi:hypothetical protein
VHEARHLAVAVEDGDPLLEPADHEHPSVQFEEVGRTEHEACTVLVGTKREQAMPDQIEPMFPDLTDPDVDSSGVRDRRGGAA